MTGRRLLALGAVLTLTACGAGGPDEERSGGASDAASTPAGSAEPPEPTEAPDPTEAPASTELPPFTGTIEPLSAALRDQMTGVSHDPDSCPITLDALRLLTVTHLDFDGAATQGRIVVAEEVAEDVQGVFERLYEERFPIRSLRLIDDFDGDDDASMAANNSSGYNCRRVAGSTSWSQHAYGRAVDINPVQNPYLTAAGILPPRGSAFADVDRSPGADAEPGVIVRGDVVVESFAAIGWQWGGEWRSADYHHFDAR